MVRDDIRNVAIIAHVDHGKTTLVDGLLKQSHVFRANQQVGELIMDSNDLERERGITILAKNTAIRYRGVKINIIDTPGHADFSGEVERVLNMADGCLLLIDAVDGPMPQTRFVLREAFRRGLRPIVVINKMDRPHARAHWVLLRTQDLFLELASHAEQLDFPVLYTVAKEGLASLDPEQQGKDLEPLFEAILQHVPPPAVDQDAPLQLLVAALDYDQHRGQIAVGRLFRGRLRAGQQVARIARGGALTRHRITYLLTYAGLKREPVEEALPGDIVALCGIDDIAIGETVADPESPEALPLIEVGPPTVKMTFGVNTSPMAGRDGRYCTSRQLRERLFRELRINVSLRVQDTDSADEFLVSGRGELHLAILIETMRREGYEFQVSRPEVILGEEGGHVLEPVEQVFIDCSADAIGAISQSLGQRKGQLLNMVVGEGSATMHLEYRVSTRGLIGFRSKFLTMVRGAGSLYTSFLGYHPWYGEILSERSGVLVASEIGVAVAFGLENAQERGVTFVEPGTDVYPGMLVGMHQREQDIAINVCKTKKMTNVRSSTQEIQERLTPALKFSLEESLDFINTDELLEVTPKALRMRKRLLSQDARSRARKALQPA
ncbi:MAG: translational GTPase TypA [Dehalococcoidia bacterium]|nr:translational GTPase TypA [Dehalococcoidia bacterium]